MAQLVNTENKIVVTIVISTMNSVETVQLVNTWRKTSAVSDMMMQAQTKIDKR